MKTLLPARGPVDLPRFGRLKPGHRPKDTEVVVLTRGGRYVELPRGMSPPFAYRLVGGYRRAYFVSPDRQTRTWEIMMQSRTGLKDVRATVIIELKVTNCTELLRYEWDLDREITSWCEEKIAEGVVQFGLSDPERIGPQLITISRVASELLSTSQHHISRPPGLEFKIVRVRLESQRAETIDDTFNVRARIDMLRDKYGQDFAQMYATVITDANWATELGGWMSQHIRERDEYAAQLLNSFIANEEIPHPVRMKLIVAAISDRSAGVVPSQADFIRNALAKDGQAIAPALDVELRREGG